jgi:hypothetical protein
MPKRRNNTRKPLKTFHAALVAHGLPARLMYRGTLAVWEDRRGRFNTAHVGMVDVRPTTLRLSINNYATVVRGKFRKPEGPFAGIVFLPGEEECLADPLAEILASDTPEDLSYAVHTPAAWMADPPDGCNDPLRELYRFYGILDFPTEG